VTATRVPDRDDQGATDQATRAAREPGELVVTLSPRQIVGGFAFVAALIVWLVRIARRKG
jgi:hypothetical protein